MPSRVGKKEIPIPAGVSVAESGGVITVKGPKGELTHRLAGGVKVEVLDGMVKVLLHDPLAGDAIHGVTRAVLANHVKGVSQGFTRALEIVGTGYRAQVQGRNLILSLGFSHPVEFPLPEGINAKAEPQTRIELSGVNRELLGQVAADIRSIRPPEPYKGKGVKYEGEYIRRKAGKSVGGGSS